MTWVSNDKCRTLWVDYEVSEDFRKQNAMGRHLHPVVDYAILMGHRLERVCSWDCREKGVFALALVIQSGEFVGFALAAKDVPDALSKLQGYSVISVTMVQCSQMAPVPVE